MRWLCLVALGLVASAARGERYELSVEIEASVAEARAEAEVRAAGRLEMSGQWTESGGLMLTLTRILESPWKFYWVDPWGPFGEEVKVASVIDLPDGSWDSLDLARREAQEEALGRYEVWAKQRPASPAFDGSFAFVIIGPTRGRFGVELRPGLDPARVTNELTKDWLSGPFDQWVGSSWETTQPGYWFWNATVEGPFDYEPHTYHALAEALSVLSLGAVAEPGWAVEAIGAMSSTLGTLVPRIGPMAGFDLLPASGTDVASSGAPGNERFEFANGSWVERRTNARGIPTAVSVGIDTESLRSELRVTLTPLPDP